jgi:pyridoxal phosphate enzyme (YggS family)
MSAIVDRLVAVREKIAQAASAAGRDPAAVELVAVSKTHPAESVREAGEAGQIVFGENRVQELLAKAPLLPSHLRWHLIGHLQKNKIRKALPVVDLIHGVNSLDLAQDIDRVAAELGLFPRVLLEVNVSGEGTKFGFKPDLLRSELDTLLTLPRVQIEGLMTIAPYVEDPEDVRPVFASLRDLRDELARRSGTPLTTLSMGMSGDYEIAIAEGATLVRVGTAIFGDRPQKVA